MKKFLNSERNMGYGVGSHCERDTLYLHITTNLKSEQVLSWTSEIEQSARFDSLSEAFAKLCEAGINTPADSIRDRFVFLRKDRLERMDEDNEFVVEQLSNAAKEKLTDAEYRALSHTIISLHNTALGIIEADEMSPDLVTIDEKNKVTSIGGGGGGGDGYGFG